MRERMCWNDYFMCQAIWASERSPDESTQHGCIIINEYNVPIAQGYNGFPHGCNDKSMPQTRPEKYKVILHSELNAILNATESLRGATLYVSGMPCVQCWCAIIQTNISCVIYGPVNSKSISDSAHKDDTLDNELVQKLLHNRSIVIVKWKPENLNLIINGTGRINRLSQIAAGSW